MPTLTTAPPLADITDEEFQRIAGEGFKIEATLGGWYEGHQMIGEGGKWVYLILE
ncbi:MAG: hypothetical protein ABIH37_05360 [archaeon]